MWGARNGIVQNIVDLINSYSKKDSNNRKNIDQEFLAEKIYPAIISRAIVHDPLRRYGHGKEFPIPRKRPWREDIQPDILQYLNSTLNHERIAEYFDYDKDHDNDFIGKIASVTEDQINWKCSK
jgi:hypothetical protein